MKIRKVVAVFLLAVASLWIAPRAGHAWNPNTHNYSGSLARADAVDNELLRINGRDYPVRPEVVAALRDWPAHYDAGVVGPDGFPDIMYGQVVIHTTGTGQWLGHILGRAWAAQSDGSYSAEEKSQILAFSYGYLTHAAGDMWAHTMVNDFSDPSGTIGVFPGYGDILTSLDKAAIAVRHLILERYMADATPGWDVNPERGPAPGGDISDDSSPAQPYGAPHRFVYETLVDPAAPTPVPAVRGSYTAARGPLIGRFLELRDDLQDFVDYDPDPLADAIDAYNDTIEDLMALECACNFGDDDAEGCSNSCCPFDICNDFCDGVHDLVACPAACLELGITFLGDTFEAFLDLIAGVAEELALVVLDAYVSEWIDDINDGLRNWSQLGLALSRGMFDPQTRRNLQNDKCQYQGGENTLLRAQCEEDIGTLDVVLHEVDPFLNEHLLSMIGLPDFVGEVREIVGDVTDVLNDILGYIGLPFNPIQEGLAVIKEFIKELILDTVSQVLGVDLEALGELVKSPFRFLCLQDTPFQLPDPLGAVTLPLYPAGTVARLDGLMNMPPNSHVAEFGLPADCGRFADDAAFDSELFDPFRNSTLMAKLLLLDGPQINQVLSDLTGRTITTYAPGENIMVKSLDSQTWLKMIDGDHAWRQDGAPTFPLREAALIAGTGQFPAWESCVLRNTFRSLFVDWENDTLTFPDLADPISADPENDPNAPVSSLPRAGAFYDDGVHQFVAADNVFTHTAADGPTGKAFAANELQLQHRFYPVPGLAGPFISTGQPATFSLTGSDGLYTIEVRSGDPCHTCAEGDGLDPEPTQSSAYVLDATPPVTTCATPPFGQVFDTDDLSTVDYSLSDGPLGSGVASESSTLDGYLTEAGVTPTADGGLLDMYLLYPGIRTVAVASSDNLGNSGTGACTFEIRPTAASMLSNLNRAMREGAIKNQGIFTSLQAMLENADRAGARGNCGAEMNILNAFAHELRAQRGSGVDALIADRFIAYAEYLIITGDPRCESSFERVLDEGAGE
ncbi:MAG: hypothetical protein ABIS67_15435 [Candidatus Eisenbacteria bacterium]